MYECSDKELEVSRQRHLITLSNRRRFVLFSCRCCIEVAVVAVLEDCEYVGVLGHELVDNLFANDESGAFRLNLLLVELISKIG